jgi:MFS family permease
MSNSGGDETVGGAAFRDVLRNPNFLKLWMAQLFSQLAQQIINIALVLQVAPLNKATATAGIVVAFTLPAILFSAIAGVVVERQSKKWMLVVTNVARGVSVLLFILIAVFDKLDPALSLPVLYINTLIFSTVSQFFAPAEATMIPLLVNRKLLIAANALFNLTLTASQLVGFVFLGPVLLGLFGFRWLYVVLFGFYVFCAFLTWRLPDVEPEDEDDAARAGTLRDKARETWEDLREGWEFIRRDASLVIAILYWSVAIAVFMMVATVATKFLDTVLHVDPTHLYFVLVPGGLGLIVGVATVGRFATEKNRGSIINYSMIVAGACLLVLVGNYDFIKFVMRTLGQPEPDVHISQVIIGAMAFILGIANSFISVPAQTILQERAPETIRARVFAAFYTVSNIILIVPLVITGAVADVIGVLPTVVGISILVLGIAWAGWFYQERHRSVLAPPPTPQNPPAGMATAGPPSPADEPEALLSGVAPVELGARDREDHHHQHPS